MEDGALNITRDEEGVSYSPKVAPPAPDPVGPSTNIAERIDQTNLDAIAEALTENVAFDEEGQDGTDEIAEEVIDLMGLSSEGKPDSDDEYADTSSHPMMLTALLRFQAKALAAILPSDDEAVRTKPVHDPADIEDEKKREAAQEKLSHIERRVSAFYTEYLFKRLPAYEDETDQILMTMGQHGLGIRKVVVDRSRKNTPVMPEMVRGSDLIVSYDTTNFRCGRLTHRMELDTGTLIRRMNSGMYRAIKLSDHSAPDVSGAQAARDQVYGFKPGHYQGTETHRIYEIYDELFLEDDKHPDGLPRPYIITIHAQTREVLSIQRNWKPDDKDEMPMEHFVGYLYHPGRSAVTGVGLGQILLQVTKSLRKAQRRMLEAGYLQNHPSGFKHSNLSIRDGETRVRAGEFVDVDSPTGNIHDALMVHPFQGPSEGLMALTQNMQEHGRELGGIATIDFKELMKSGVAAGPAMAAFEESTEFQTAVHRRLYKAHRTELEIIHDRMRTIMGDRTVLYGVDQHLQPGDLQAVDILPYMKPGQASKQRAIMEAQAIWEIAQASPDVMHKRAAAEGYVRALGSSDADRLILPAPDEEEVVPADAVTEYNMILAGKPVKAGLSQNHQAHIDSHTAQLKMLQSSQLPVEQGDAASAILAAHISEHLGMQLTVQVSQATGIPVEQMGPNMSPEIEARVAPAIAQAVQQIEEMRRPPDDSGEKAAIEGIKQRGALQREVVKVKGDQSEQEMKNRHELELKALEHEHERELQKMKDDAAMEREVDDNAMALRIAKLGTGSQNAGAKAGNSE